MFISQFRSLRCRTRKRYFFLKKKKGVDKTLIISSNWKFQLAFKVKWLYLENDSVSCFKIINFMLKMITYFKSLIFLL